MDDTIINDFCLHFSLGNLRNISQSTIQLLRDSERIQWSLWEWFILWWWLLMLTHTLILTYCVSYMELVATHKLTTYSDIHTTLVYCTCFVNTLIQSLSPRMNFLSSFYIPCMRGQTISAYPLLYVLYWLSSATLW